MTVPPEMPTSRRSLAPADPPAVARRRHQVGHPGPALVTVKTGRLTLHRAKGCRTRAFNAGQTFLELGPDDVNLTRNETGGVTETVVTFLLPVGAPVTVDAPAPRHCPL